MRTLLSTLLGLFLIHTVLPAKTVETTYNMRLWTMHEARDKMDWDQAVRYCHSLQSQLPSVEMLEFASRNSGSVPEGSARFQYDYYWSRTELDMQGAYSFDFGLGLAYPDHKGNRYRVMCIK